MVGAAISAGPGGSCGVCADCIFGSSTASAWACRVLRGLRILVDLAGHGRSGLDSHGNCQS